MTRIGIVGAGAAAAAAAYTLEQTIDDAEITVLEKSGGLCGRAATRRRDDVVYDYGANYVKSDDERVTDLLTETLETDGLVDVTEPIWTFNSDGKVSEGRDADEHKWTYREGLTQIAKRLFGRTDAAVHRNTRVEQLGREAATGRWRLADADGEVWGPFDSLLLNPPAPQTAALLRSAEWDAADTEGDWDAADTEANWDAADTEANWDAADTEADDDTETDDTETDDTDLRETLVNAIEDVPYRTIWTVVLHYPFELERPYYALVNTDKEHAVGWIAREECKPGHVPDGESLLIVQANHEWSVERFDESADANLEELASVAADLLEDERLTDPDWTDHQGWRYALPEDGAPTGPLRSAEAQGLYCLGDWVAGEGRLHAALRNGLETGERIALERSVS